MLTKADYINYLIVSRGNYTCTNLAQHLEGVSHDQVNRFLSDNHFDSKDLRDIVAPFLTETSGGFLLVDDSVQDKKYSKFIELAKVQYSGNTHGLVNGINLVNVVYTSGEPGDFMPIDFRIYAPEVDGLTKNQHFREMFSRIVTEQKISARTILFDTWYASSENLKAIHRAGWTFFTTLKGNRLVNPSKESRSQRLDSLEYAVTAWNDGIKLRIKEVPFDVYLFRIVAQDGDIEWVVTNQAPEGLTAEKVVEITRKRWQIEEFHRSFKQLTGSEKCQCRRAICQQNHLTCCYLAWNSLRQFARTTGQTIYQASKSIWSDYLRQLLKNPLIPVLGA